MTTTATLDYTRAIDESEYRQRYARVQEAMRDAGYQALILFADSIRSSNVRYVVDFRPIDGVSDIAWAVVTIPQDGDATLYASQMNLLWAQEVSWFAAKPFSSMLDDLVGLRRTVGTGAKVGAAGLSFMPAGIRDMLEGAFALSGAVLEPAEGVLGPIKATKSETERMYLRRAGELTVVMLDAIKVAVTSGGEKTEREIAAYAAAEILRAGGDSPAMDIQIQSGIHSAYNNIRSTNRVVRPGDSILIEGGVRYDPYVTDIARGATYGEVDPRQIEIIEVAAAALGAGCDALRPGITAGALNSVIVQSLADAGYRDYSAEARGYGTGHGIGTDIEEEEPWIRPNSDFVIAENMAIALKASIFIPGLAGVRVEDNVLVTETGYEVTTPYPRVNVW